MIPKPPLSRPRRLGALASAILLQLLAVQLASSGLRAAQPESNLFDAPRPRLEALRIDEPVAVDGVFDEGLWSKAPQTSGFLQQNPDEGQPASQRTEVRVAYDDVALYFAILAHDDEPSAILAKEMRRDGRLRNDDSIAILLDTYRDRRNAYLFETNPNRAKSDALITDEGRDFNREWDGVWRVGARRTELGWQTEIAIPFSTLRYDPSLDTWGLQVLRRIARRNESSFWAPVPSEADFFRVSLAGDLALRVERASRQLDLKPFLTGGRSESTEDGDGNDLDAGLDVKWGVTRSTRLDLTLNTDFAETEVDEQRVNLTRFSLFFPEKREFFLENAGIFDFGPRRERRGRSSPLLQVFFSRRIGIADTEQVGIDWGARYTGRVGPWSFGLLDVQTESFAGTDDVAPLGTTNWGAFRVKRNLGRRSSVGAILTNRDEAGGVTNRVYGLDLDFNPTARFNLNAFVAQSDDDSLEGDDWTAGAAASFQGREWQGSFEALQISEAFEPGIGFLLRDDIRRFKPKLEYSPIINRFGIRNWNFGVESEYVTTTDGVLESRRNQLTLFGFRSLRGDFFGIEVDERSERLFDEFEISDGVILAAGRYDFDPQWSLSLFSTESRPVAARLNLSTGGFWSGERDSASVTLTLRPSRHLRSETTANLNKVELPEGDFDSNVYRQRISVALSPEYLLNGLLQYNERDEELGLNLRFNWIYRPGADLFVVYNQSWTAPSLGDLSTRDRQLVLKFTYLIQR